MKTFGLSVGAENAKQIGGIFPTMPLKCAAVLGSPSPFAHCVVFGWCISSGELRAGSQGFPACCVAIISFCLFVCTITELRFKDTSDLWTSYFNRTNRDHVCAFSGAFRCSVLPRGAIYSNTHSSSRTCQNTRLRILNIIVMRAQMCYTCCS